MDAGKLKINMFGSFTVSMGDRSIDDKTDRSKKLWLLLAFLVSRRPQPAKPEELADLLWGADAERSASSLKISMHRLRTMLDKLGPGMGHHLICYEAGSYHWNPEAEAEVDAESFELLCSQARGSSDEEYVADCLEKAQALYSGPFLERLSSEAWVVPVAAHYHNLYIKAVTELLPLLEKMKRFEQAAAVAERAIAIDPYYEEFYRRLMEYYIELDRPEDTVRLYETLRKMMLDEFGVIPEEDTRAVGQKAVRMLNGHIIHVDFIKNQLREPDSRPGCMICDYDFFKVLYRAEARAIVRSGDCVHISLVTITGENGGDLAPRSLERAMDNMEEVIRTSLRKGDIASRCSSSQFVMMLPQANYENSRMVSERVLRAFTRRYPHSPARLDYSVWALEPSE